MLLGYISIESLKQGNLKLESLSASEVIELLVKSFNYVEQWEPYLLGSKVDTSQSDSWPRTFISVIPLAVKQVQLQALELIHKEITLEVVDRHTVANTTDEEVLSAINKMDALMVPFLRGEGFFTEEENAN